MFILTHAGGGAAARLAVMGSGAASENADKEKGEGPGGGRIKGNANRQSR